MYDGKGFHYALYFDAVNNQVDSIYIYRDRLTETADFYREHCEGYVEAEIFDIINSARVKNGLEPLLRNSVSDSVAKEHSAEMKTSPEMNYISKNGDTPFERMTKAGIKFDIAAENISKAVPGDAIDIYAKWMNNVSTRSNILSEVFDEVGIGSSIAPILKSFYTTADMFSNNAIAN